MNNTGKRMTPEKLLQHLQTRIGDIASDLSDIPSSKDQIEDINHCLQDVIIDLECVRDYLKVKH